ncbi:MAG: thiamine-phosphate kinase [Thermoanaerobaculia bacterium]|nr:thiamine-phosphate kinase [Thermoanaerobaculia bacterium]
MPASPEDQVLAAFRRRPGTALLGDDTAHLVLPPGRDWVVTTDAQIAGVHFPTELDAPVVARRLLAVNLSDLAAAGATPSHALLALVTPEGSSPRRFLDAFLDACQTAGVTLAGGDLARGPVLHGTATLFGTVPAAGPFASRSGGRPGDALWVGGSLGESGAGRLVLAEGAHLAGDHVVLPASLRATPDLAAAARAAVRRHLAPTPQLELGSWLRETGRAAVMDLSDGLARDLPRLAARSGCGAEIDEAELPSSPGFSSLAQALGADPVELAFEGGEDYVLLFCLPAGLSPPEHFGARPLGRLIAGDELRVVSREGERRPWPTGGWDHLG